MSGWQSHSLVCGRLCPARRIRADPSRAEFTQPAVAPSFVFVRQLFVYRSTTVSAVYVFQAIRLRVAPHQLGERFYISMSDNGLHDFLLVRFAA